MVIASTVEWVVSIATLVAAIVGTPLIIWKVGGKHSDRLSEDEARDFYAEHGHWPDQTPEEAAAERRAAAAALGLRDAEPDADGRV